MTSFIRIDDSTEFKTFVLVSVAIHLSIVFSVAIKNFLSSDDLIVIPASIRVDMVALPDKIQDAEPAAAQPISQPPPMPEKSEPKKDTLDKTKRDQKKALDKLNAMSAIEKMRSEVNKPNEKTPEAPKQYKGNIISSGSGFTGIAQLRVNEYLQKLSGKIHSQWVLPQWLSDASLKAVAVLAVDGRGQLIRKEIHVSSGNSVFDSSCLAAIEASAPFEPPPREFEEALIGVNFPE